MSTGFARAALALVFITAGPSLALAQALFGNSKPAAPAQVPPPPALPGATSTGDAAPSRRIPTDMEPTEALFDAINRGDIGGARDAISRGADLNGRNVLGMSPTELAVDLGRNDITFMLLSMRGADGLRLQPAGSAATAKKSPPVKQARQVPARSPTATRTVAPVPSQTARLFSGDGGAPNPNAGFLGFDSNRR